jgi:hypothetical protein
LARLFVERRRVAAKFWVGRFWGFCCPLSAGGFESAQRYLGNEVESAFLWRVPAARAVVWFGVGLWLICVAGASSFKSKASVKIALVKV